MKFGNRQLDLVMIGNSILSSYGNPVAELYRGLINELAQYGHRTTFLERENKDKYQYRDMLRSPYCEVWTYQDTDQLLSEYRRAIQSADVVILGNGVEESDRIAAWIAEEARGITVYYDSNLARTIKNLEGALAVGDCLSCRTVSNFNLFLSTTGGPALSRLKKVHDVSFPRPLYESVDPYTFYRTDTERQYDLGFIGNHKAERAAQMEDMLFSPARFTPNRQFSLAGGGYDKQENWPRNLTYLEYLPETNLVDFYNRQRCMLVISRADRKELGFTPSRRLLTAAACGVPVLTEDWEGLEEFFEPHREVFCVNDKQGVLDVLYGTEESHRNRVGAEARRRILGQHTISHRAQQLLEYLDEVAD
ncbi:glycosyltransferase [Lewinella sp. W8]|uniref:CgeB family protein n=1 Tax=Lewinella sp. W8 TaxID=2528208 RepID=UPI0015645CF5